MNSGFANLIISALCSATVVVATTSCPALASVEQVSHLSNDEDKQPNADTIQYQSSRPASSELAGLSVLQALNEALKAGPRAASVRAQLAITRANFATATQSPNPSFFFDRGIMAEQVNRLGPVVVGDAPWNLFFRLLVAKRLAAQTKLDLLTTIWSLRNDVRRAYVELAMSQETQKTLVELYDLSARLLKVSQKRFDAGAAPELDVMKARLSTSKAEVDVRVGGKRVIRAKQQLNILMGRQMDSPLSIPNLPNYATNEPRFKLDAQKTDILPDFNRGVAPVQLFIEKALQSRLELKSLAIQLQLNQANANANYANVIPNPNFAFGKSTAGNPATGPKLTAVFMTLNQGIPICNVQQGAIYQYKATRYQLGYQIGSQENQVIGDVSNAYYNLIAWRDKIRIYQERLLPDSNEVARLARRSYEAGQSGITDALQAQQTYIQTQNDYLLAVSAYASAFSDLEFAIGKPLQ